MAAVTITSIENPKVKLISKLSNKRERDKTGLFLIEGYREILRALDAKVEIDTLLFCEELFLGENEHSLIQRIDKKKVFSTLEKIFKKVSYRDRPDGLIAIAHKRVKQLDDLKEIIKKKKNSFLLVCESIEKPGNLGSILRSSDGARVDAVILCDPTCDLFNPNVVRSSIGTLFTQPVIEASSEEVLNLLQENKIKILAATPHAKTNYTEVNLKESIAIIMGTEQIGLSALWMEKCDIQVKIPMLGQADSLNVAAATTLLLYEVVRQRGF